MRKSYVSFSLLLFVFCAFAMEQQEPQQVRIMTYNIRRAGKEKKEERLWSNRLPLIKKIIERIKPDIMGLQEVTETQLTDLKKTFPDFTAFGTSRGSSWFGLGADEYNPILYDTNKMTFIKGATFRINESNGYFGWTPLQATATGLLPRICTLAQFKDKRTSKNFLVLNTHLDNNYQEARINGLTRINNYLKEHAESDSLPIILMGDFNTEIDSEILKIIPTFRHATDKAKEIYGPRETRTGWEDEELKSIDHILINNAPGINVLRYETLEKQEGAYPSDHWPVFADVTFDGQ